MLCDRRVTACGPCSGHLELQTPHLAAGSFGWLTHGVCPGVFCRCLAHTVWVGSSFMVATSLGLMVHHLFGCWHGDRRLSAKYGEVGWGVVTAGLNVTCCKVEYKQHSE